MKIVQSYKIILLNVLFAFLITSCSKEVDTVSFENSSLVTVKIQGTQSSFSTANIDVLEVQFRVLEDETDPNAWVALNTINRGIYDLTQTTNNRVITLVDFQEVPSDFIYSIKLVLGNENTFAKNGVEYELDVNQENEKSSVNILDKQLVENKLYDFVLEFNIDESIEVGSGVQANFNPKMNTQLRLFNLY